MKTRALIIAALGSVLAASVAQAAYTKQNARLPRVQIETSFVNGSGTATAAKVDAFVENVVINDSDSADVLNKGAWRVVSFDLLDAALTNTNITAATKTVTYPQLAALIRQACLDRANAQGISQLFRFDDNRIYAAGERPKLGGLFVLSLALTPGLN